MPGSQSPCSDYSPEHDREARRALGQRFKPSDPATRGAMGSTRCASPARTHLLSVIGQGSRRRWQLACGALNADPSRRAARDLLVASCAHAAPASVADATARRQRDVERRDAAGTHDVITDAIESAQRAVRRWLPNRASSSSPPRHAAGFCSPIGKRRSGTWSASKPSSSRSLRTPRPEGCGSDLARRRGVRYLAFRAASSRSKPPGVCSTGGAESLNQGRRCWERRFDCAGDLRTADHPHGEVARALADRRPVDGADWDAVQRRRGKPGRACRSTDHGQARTPSPTGPPEAAGTS